MPSLAWFIGNLLNAQSRITQLESELGEARLALQELALPEPPSGSPRLISPLELSALLGNISVMYLDSTYRVWPEAEFTKFLVELRKRTRREYEAEVFDCDNYALDFMDTAQKWGTNCGLVTGSVSWTTLPHAWNVVVVDGPKGAVRLQIEPYYQAVAPEGYSPSWALMGG